MALPTIPAPRRVIFFIAPPFSYMNFAATLAGREFL
jgi:hypothetical protein